MSQPVHCVLEPSRTFPIQFSPGSAISDRFGGSADIYSISNQDSQKYRQYICGGNVYDMPTSQGKIYLNPAGCSSMMPSMQLVRSGPLDTTERIDAQGYYLGVTDRDALRSTPPVVFNFCQ